MFVRADVLLGGALLVMASSMASSVQAAPFDDLKEDFAACLRFELDGVKGPRPRPVTAGPGLVLRKCTAEMDRLDRADPRRLRSDRGLSPSTWAVIESVFGPGSRGRLSGARF